MQQAEDWALMRSRATSRTLSTDEVTCNKHGGILGTDWVTCNKHDCNSAWVEIV